MAEAVVSFTIERLGDLLISEAKFLSGVKGQVDDIQAALTRMKCYLQDADAKQHENQTIRNWVREIRDLSYRTEDVLETFAAEVATKRDKGGIEKALKRFSSCFCECMALHKIGLEFETIKAKMTELTTNLQTCEQIKALHEGESSYSNWEQLQSVRMSYSHLTRKDFDFVGMEKEIKELISFLKNEDEGCEVISIWGMGGQGKSTLARQVCNHVEVRSSFQAFAWVCISQQYQKIMVLRDILIQLVPEYRSEIMTMEDRELVEMLHKVQQDKNCLIIMDDIWSEATWESLEPAFPIGKKVGSKVMLTTRMGKVAKAGTPYKLRPLSDEESWKLFLKKAFPKKEDDTSEVKVDIGREKLGKVMVLKCRGLPLAISTLGGILKRKTQLREWELISKDVASYLSRGEGEEEEYGTVRQILALSYDSLPYRLKHCFLYLGIFPEDTNILTEKLYLKWMAEGLISPKNRAKGEMMIEVAEGYLGELAERSLVEVVVAGTMSFLKFEGCRIHDLTRDMCLTKGKEEDFLKVIDSRDQHDQTLVCSSSTTSESNRARRLAIHLYDNEFDLATLEQQNMIRQLRSLILYGATYHYPDVALTINLFKSLRVLELEQINLKVSKAHFGIGELIYLRYLSFRDQFRELPSSEGNLIYLRTLNLRQSYAMTIPKVLLWGIGELIYLRYLSIGRGAGLRELPSSVGNLRYLQTLDLRQSYAMIIPNVLWKMKQLKYLYLPTHIGLRDAKNLRFDGLSELEMIAYLDPSTCEVNDILKLTSLRALQGIKVTNIPDLAGIINILTISNVLTSLDFGHIPNFGSEEGTCCLRQMSRSHYHIYINGVVSILPPVEVRNPPQHFSQSRLTSIALDDCQFQEDPMTLLEKLPNLQSLNLYYNAYIGKEMVCTATGFPQLITLVLRGQECLVKWRVDEGAMPRLSKLRIDECEKLDMLPDGLRFLTALQELILSHMPQTFVERVRVINGVEGEDFYKVRHVPSIAAFP